MNKVASDLSRKNASFQTENSELSQKLDLDVGLSLFKLSLPEKESASVTNISKSNVTYTDGGALHHNGCERGFTMQASERIFESEKTRAPIDVILFPFSSEDLVKLLFIFDSIAESFEVKKMSNSSSVRSVLLNLTQETQLKDLLDRLLDTELTEERLNVKFCHTGICPPFEASYVVDLTQSISQTGSSSVDKDEDYFEVALGNIPTGTPSTYFKYLFPGCAWVVPYSFHRQNPYAWDTPAVAQSDSEMRMCFKSVREMEEFCACYSQIKVGETTLIFLYKGKMRPYVETDETQGSRKSRKRRRSKVSDKRDSQCSQLAEVNRDPPVTLESDIGNKFVNSKSKRKRKARKKARYDNLLGALSGLTISESIASGSLDVESKKPSKESQNSELVLIQEDSALIVPENRLIAETRPKIINSNSITQAAPKATADSNFIIQSRSSEITDIRPEVTNSSSVSQLRSCVTPETKHKEANLSSLAQPRSSRTPETGPKPRPSVTPETGPKPRPSVTPETGPRKGPTVTPETGPKPRPSVTPETGPRKGPSVTPETGPRKGPTVTPETGPKPRPSVTPETGPKTKYSVTPKTGPRKGPTVTPETGPRKGPTVTPETGPKPRPSVTLETGPKKGPSVAPETGAKKGPSVTQETGPKKGPSVTPETGPKKGPSVTPETGPKPRASVTPETGPKPRPTVTPETGPKPRPSITPETGPKPRPSVTPETGPKPRPSVTPETGPKPRPSVTPETGPKPRPSVTPETGPKPRPSVTPETGPKRETSITPETGSKTRPRRTPETRPKVTNLSPATQSRPGRTPETGSKPRPSGTLETRSKETNSNRQPKLSITLETMLKDSNLSSVTQPRLSVTPEKRRKITKSGSISQPSPSGTPETRPKVKKWSSVTQPRQSLTPETRPKDSNLSSVQQPKWSVTPETRPKVTTLSSVTQPSLTTDPSFLANSRHEVTKPCSMAELRPDVTKQCSKAEPRPTATLDPRSLVGTRTEVKSSKIKSTQVMAYESFTTDLNCKVTKTSCLSKSSLKEIKMGSILESSSKETKMESKSSLKEMKTSSMSELSSKETKKRFPAKSSLKETKTNVSLEPSSKEMVESSVAESKSKETKTTSLLKSNCTKIVMKSIAESGRSRSKSTPRKSKTSSNAEARSKEIKNSSNAELSSNETKTSSAEESSSTETKTNPTAKSSSKETKKSSTAESSSKESKTNSTAESSSTEIKTNSTAELSSKETKTNSTAESSSTEIKTNSTAELSSKETKTNSTAESSSKETKASSTRESIFTETKTSVTAESSSKGTNTSSTAQSSSRGTKTSSTAESSPKDKVTDLTSESTLTEKNISSIPTVVGRFIESSSEATETSPEAESFSKETKTSLNASWQMRRCIPTVVGRFIHSHVSSQGSNNYPATACSTQIFPNIDDASHALPMERVPPFDQSLLQIAEPIARPCSVPFPVFNTAMPPPHLGFGSTYTFANPCHGYPVDQRLPYRPSRPFLPPVRRMWPCNRNMWHSTRPYMPPFHSRPPGNFGNIPPYFPAGYDNPGAHEIYPDPTLAENVSWEEELHYDKEQKEWNTLVDQFTASLEKPRKDIKRQSNSLIEAELSQSSSPCRVTNKTSPSVLRGRNAKKHIVNGTSWLSKSSAGSCRHSSGDKQTTKCTKQASPDSLRLQNKESSPAISGSSIPEKIKSVKYPVVEDMARDVETSHEQAVKWISTCKNQDNLACKLQAASTKANILVVSCDKHADTSDNSSSSSRPRSKSDSESCIVPPSLKKVHGNADTETKVKEKRHMSKVLGKPQAGENVKLSKLLSPESFKKSCSKDNVHRSDSHSQTGDERSNLHSAKIDMTGKRLKHLTSELSYDYSESSFLQESSMSDAFKDVMSRDSLRAKTNDTHEHSKETYDMDRDNNSAVRKNTEPSNFHRQNKRTLQDPGEANSDFDPLNLQEHKKDASVNSHELSESRSPHENLKRRKLETGCYKKQWAKLRKVKLSTEYVGNKSNVDPEDRRVKGKAHTSSISSFQPQDSENGKSAASTDSKNSRCGKEHEKNIKVRKEFKRVQQLSDCNLNIHIATVLGEEAMQEYTKQRSNSSSPARGPFACKRLQSSSPKPWRMKQKQRADSPLIGYNVLAEKAAQEYKERRFNSPAKERCQSTSPKAWMMAQKQRIDSPLIGTKVLDEKAAQKYKEQRFNSPGKEPLQSLSPKAWMMKQKPRADSSLTRCEETEVSKCPLPDLKWESRKQRGKSDTHDVSEKLHTTSTAQEKMNRRQKKTSLLNIDRHIAAESPQSTTLKLERESKRQESNPQNRHAGIEKLASYSLKQKGTKLDTEKVNRLPLVKRARKRQRLPSSSSSSSSDSDESECFDTRATHVTKFGHIVFWGKHQTEIQGPKADSVTRKCIKPSLQRNKEVRERVSQSSAGMNIEKSELRSVTKHSKSQVQEKCHLSQILCEERGRVSRRSGMSHVKYCLASSDGLEHLEGKMSSNPAGRKQLNGGLSMKNALSDICKKDPTSSHRENQKSLLKSSDIHNERNLHDQIQRSTYSKESLSVKPDSHCVNTYSAMKEHKKHEPLGGPYKCKNLPQSSTSDSDDTSEEDVFPQGSWNQASSSQGRQVSETTVEEDQKRQEKELIDAFAASANFQRRILEALARKHQAPPFQRGTDVNLSDKQVAAPDNPCSSHRPELDPLHGNILMKLSKDDYSETFPLMKDEMSKGPQKSSSDGVMGRNADCMTLPTDSGQSFALVELKLENNE